MILKKHTVSPFAIALIFLGIWLALGMAINTSLYADNFEQFDWAHGMEIGYWKHPPITTWILIAFQSLAGVHVFNTYIVCFVCWAVTLYFYWRLARLLLPSHLADFALLLLSSTYMLTWRAQLFNHNVTLVMMTTITTGGRQGSFHEGARGNAGPARGALHSPLAQGPAHHAALCNVCCSHVRARGPP